MRRVSLSREAARALETGRWDGLVSRALATALAPVAARGLVRPAFVPSDIALVCVGGSTLGGSGKTRVALACAFALASSGASVALVGHAYRAAPRTPRVVSPEATREEVGDEALVCARELAARKLDVPVVVGPTRQAAIDHAVQLSPAVDAIVLDGPIGIRGRSRERSVSLLAVDANRPWGSGRLPPAGDLRAPREVLLAHADHVVAVDAMPAAVRWPSGAAAPLGSLRTASVGLFTAMARPDRLVRALAAAGIRPKEVLSVADHGSVAGVAGRLRTAPVDAWIGTAKCALRLQRGRLSLGVPVGILEAADTPLPPPVLEALAGLWSSSVPYAPRLHGVP